MEPTDDAPQTAVGRHTGDLVSNTARIVRKLARDASGEDNALEVRRLDVVLGHFLIGVRAYPVPLVADREADSLQRPHLHRF